MAKTEETIKLEKQIYKSTIKKGVFGCYEVTIGWYGKERVDYMTYDTKGIFRCYEIKVSKADFHSKAKVTFVGHYNYYVMPQTLFEQVKDEIPSHIGVYVGSDNRDCNLVKRAKKQELLVDDQVLKDSMIRSLTRYLEENIKNNDESYIKYLKREIGQVKRQRDNNYNELREIKNLLFSKFGPRWNRVLEEMEDMYK